MTVYLLIQSIIPTFFLVAHLFDFFAIFFLLVFFVFFRFFFEPLLRLQFVLLTHFSYPIPHFRFSRNLEEQ